MNNFKEDNQRRMDEFKAQEELKQAHELIGELTKRIIDLQFANVRLYLQISNQKRLNEISAQLINDTKPKTTKGFTPEDLKMLKDMGIAP